MPARKNGEELLEMKLLAPIRNVYDFVRMPRFQAILQRREVGGGVIGCSVALLNQGGLELQFRHIFKKNSDGAFTLAGQTFVAQFLNNRFEPRIVETLAQRVVESDAEPGINCVELILRKRDHLPPDGKIFG